ncbi:hypothetical protein ACIPW5_39095 [Streptomyces sp. NPDC090077]|uniref:hypothetical protein n=1 Tax=Streptomyces sp. NPDC090077 TaxID=3365938 RepID=UPI00380643B8
MIVYAGAVLGLLIVAGVAAYVRVALAPGRPPAASRPVDPAGGFASGAQVRASLSQEALLRAAPQVRPSLPVAPATAAKQRKGLFRGRR